MAQGATFAIVGAGQAGAWIARTLRGEGFDGRIVLIGDERHAPYSRPPLSKVILAGADDTPDLHLLPQTVQASAQIEFWPGEAVARIDRAARRLVCAQGRELTYDTLFLTTGSRAVRPGWMAKASSGRIHILRTLDDALNLRAQLVAGRRLIIVGGGWIGLEVAATARALGLEVTVVERDQRLCARSVPPVVSDWLHGLHLRQGVSLVFGAVAAACEESDDQVALSLEDGRMLRGDLCLVGVGNTPNTELAVAAGLDVQNGVVVDDQGRTRDPHIFAAGDVTSLPCPLAGGPQRRESWANAQNQAIAVAKAALGGGEPYRDLPWLWSDQYDCNIQILGLPERGARWIARGRPDQGAGSWLAIDAEGRAVGAISVNSPRDLRLVRKALSGGPPLDLGSWSSQ